MRKFSNLIASPGAYGDIQVFGLGSEDALIYRIAHLDFKGNWQQEEFLLTGQASNQHFLAVAAEQGNSNNLQIIGLEKDGSCYLVGWQDGKGNWTPGFPLPVSEPSLAFSFLTIWKREPLLQVIGLGRDDGLAYIVASQDTYGNWSAGGKLPVLDSTQSYSSLVTTSKIDDCMILGLGKEGLVYLAAQKDSDGNSWHPGGLLAGQNPGTQFFSQVVVGIMAGSKNLAVIGLNQKDGLAWLVGFYTSTSWPPSWTPAGFQLVGQDSNQSFIELIAAQGNDYYLQILGLRRDGSLQLIAWQDAHNNWHPGWKFTQGQSYSSITVAPSYNSNLNVFGLGRRNGFAYRATEQDYQTGVWSTDPGFPLPGQNQLEKYLANLKVRQSQLSADDRMVLIKKCMPVWIVHQDEEYFPKAFQTYKSTDVENLSIQEDGSCNLLPYQDTEHQSKKGKWNTMRVSDNLINQGFRLGSHEEQKAIYPRATPTYVFYLETDQGEVWIRYFLYFGYNWVPFGGVASGNHFSDWVHVSIKIVPQNNSYLPRQVYFSQHSGGALYDINAEDLRYYPPPIMNGNTGVWNYQEMRYADLPADGPWHLRVFCAKGTHETYPTAGYQIGKHWPDVTDYGYCVIPFAAGYEKEDKVPTNSKFKFSPVYAWDLSDPTCRMLDPAKWAAPPGDSSFVSCKPRLLLPGWLTDDVTDGDFDAIWLTQLIEYPKGKASGDQKMRPVRKCGLDDGPGQHGPAVDAPTYKIYTSPGKFED